MVAQATWREEKVIVILLQQFVGFFLIELPASCHGGERLNGFGGL